MYFNSGMNFFDPDSDPNDGRVVWIFVVLAAVVAVVSLVLVVISGLNLMKYNRFVEHADTTQATLIERVRELSGNRPPTIEYFLRYQFENPRGAEKCAVNRDTRTTSRNKKCFLTIHRVEVGQEAYKSAVIPSSITVLYQSHEKGTWSEPLDYPTLSRRVGLLGFLGLLSLLSGVFTWKSRRVVWASKKEAP